MKQSRGYITCKCTKFFHSGLDGECRMKGLVRCEVEWSACKIAEESACKSFERMCRSCVRKVHMACEKGVKRLSSGISLIEHAEV